MIDRQEIDREVAEIIVVLEQLADQVKGQQQAMSKQASPIQLPMPSIP